LTYINNNNFDDEKAKQIWYAYGGWTNDDNVRKWIEKDSNGKWYATYGKGKKKKKK